MTRDEFNHALNQYYDGMISKGEAIHKLACALLNLEYKTAVESDIRNLGLTVTVQNGEYRIADKEGRQVYYTTDSQDALDTAFTMAMLKGTTT